jgi:hypothetical protein
LQWFATQLIGCDYKNAICFGIWYIDYTQVAPGCSLPQRVPRIIAAGPIFTRVPQYIFYFPFRNCVLVNMRLSRFRITKVANLHPTFFPIGKLKMAIAVCLAWASEHDMKS